MKRCGKKESMRAVARRRGPKFVIRRRGGEKESCDKEERRRAVARLRALRVYLDVIS